MIFDQSQPTIESEPFDQVIPNGDTKASFIGKH